MATTIIGVFAPETVGKVTEELVNAGLTRTDVGLIEGDGDAIVSTIVGRGYEPEDARQFAEAVQAGHKLLAAKVAEDEVDMAVDIMERFEAESDGKTSEQAVPVIEERLDVEKRKVAQGGVRATSRVQERPVEETVTLKEEHVEAERRDVDRPLSDEEAKAAFQDRTIELNETAEELEIRKEARVVGEVALGKRVTERDEKVTDTVRRTEVDVEKIGSGKRGRN
jgi:uncharacterized protein (TIGR02271 family)